MGDTWNQLSSALSSALGAQPAIIGGASDEVWWRRADAAYTTNEIYMDIIEKVDMVLNEHGFVVSGGVVGEICATAKLSGSQPEVAITLQNPALLDNASFHPCVRLPKFDRDRTLNFIPPDGAKSLKLFTTLSKNHRPKKTILHRSSLLCCSMDSSIAAWTPLLQHGLLCSVRGR